MEFANETALVTGGSGAIGRAIVDELAAAGANVAVGYHSNREGADEAVRVATERGREATAIRADITDETEAEQLVTEATGLGPVTVLVNSAGVTIPRAIEESTPASVRSSLAVNVEGAFNVTRSAVERMRDGSSGSVINVSSVAAEIGSVDTSYATSKAGLLGFTRSLAREVGPDDITVNAVCPGAVDTPMNDEITEYLESQRFRGHETVDTVVDRYEAQPDEVASAVRFLAAQEFVTGEVLHVDGGMSL